MMTNHSTFNAITGDSKQTYMGLKIHRNPDSWQNRADSVTYTSKIIAQLAQRYITNEAPLGACLLITPTWKNK